MKEYAYIHEEGRLPELLEDIPFFKQFSAGHLNDILYSSYFLECEAGEVLIREGDEDQRVYILLHGAVEITKSGEFVARLATAGDVFGEMAIVSGSPRMATVTATAPTLCLVIDQQFLHELKPAGTNDGYYAAFYGFLSKLLASRLHAATTRIAGLERELERTRVVVAKTSPLRPSIKSPRRTPPRIYQRSKKTSRKK